MRTVGIVLAGGLSRRFGSPKAFASIGEEYFYERAVEALTPHCEEVVIVTRPELRNAYPAELKVIQDLPEVAGFGPLAGILSAMEFVEADRYVVLPCDMPYVDESIVGQLLDCHGEVVTAVIAEGKHHPLVSVWDRKSKEPLREQLEKGQFRVINLLDKLGVAWVDGHLLTDDEQSVFRNVNTPTDLDWG
ncbi:molybdenum cofactor guanylyltransferase [Sporosarcina sp. G11-34]|uniref:molybdenum cofactor guanylyltransferase n=1 Tax=Sporosarcina sp. G11-34 TaxID=2849605 RepID=UPI0022A9BB56|nr:molybdenum cofactor guanylyltransferase [Sporosarcina sp. G11-34]MCZ2260274.1 molybdenum cofactor guanylyltransferase [Sporosarcina sp. G11-34]